MTLDEWRAFYRELGFETIPIAPRGKRPLRKGWLAGGTEQWEGAPARANLGILTGARSGGLVVLDFDTRDGPERVLGMTPQQLAVVTIVVDTARGWHVYARGADVASGTPCAGLDVRGERGMIVAPPSVHASGHEYAFVGSHRGIVALEALSLDLVAPTEARASTAEGVDLADAEAWVRLQAPKLRDAWERLKQPPSASFDASKADFAVARCLWEGGWTPEEVALILLSLPGSRARDRGAEYARLTAERAAAIRGRAR